MTEYKDEIIIEQLKQGNSANFELLFKRYEKMVYNLGFRMLGNCQEAEDITQDIFIKVYENIGNFKGESSFKTWLYKIASTTCIDTIRKRKSLWNFINKLIERKSIEKQEDCLEKEWVQKVLNSINPNQRLLLVMHYVQGFSLKEIADIQSSTEGSIKVQIYRAREKFKERSVPYMKEGESVEV